jgi:hypothetical protein
VKSAYESILISIDSWPPLSMLLLLMILHEPIMRHGFEFAGKVGMA